MGYRQDRNKCCVWVWLPREPWTWLCIHRVLKGWAERDRAELQSQGQGDVQEPGLGDSAGESQSSPTAWCVLFRACSKIYLPLKAAPHRLPCSSALLACPSWVQMDRLGAGQEQTELLGARNTLSCFGAAHKQSKPGAPGCLL